MYAYRITSIMYLCASLVIITLCAQKIESQNNERRPSMNDKKTVEQTKSQQPPRPQEPQPPFPYNQEEISFENQVAGITLAGTLTLPKTNTNFPIVLLIAGYGSHNRNVTGMGHNYFLVLADYLTRQGIAVVRYDKRGVGASTGNYDTATTEDFANDVLAGINYLKTKYDSNHKIGLIGLSEGGLIASMVAAQSKDVDFTVLMAPAVITDVDYLVGQAALQLQADGASQEFIMNDQEVRATVYSIIKQKTDASQAETMLRNAIKHYLANQPEDQKKEAATLPFAFTEVKADALIKVFNSPWYRFFLTYDPTTVLKHINVPVLVLNGDLDWIASAHKVFPIIAQAMKEAGNKNYTMIELPGLNHMFQPCTTGALAEYAAIEETISPIALKSISDWIFKQN
jgi:uncharacterized protein